MKSDQVKIPLISSISVECCIQDIDGNWPNNEFIDSLWCMMWRMEVHKVH